jgi:hypothetical protein
MIRAESISLSGEKEVADSVLFFWIYIIFLKLIDQGGCKNGFASTRVTFERLA